MFRSLVKSVKPCFHNEISTRFLFSIPFKKLLILVFSCLLYGNPGILVELNKMNTFILYLFCFGK